MVKNILYYKFKILTKLLFILYHIISSSYAFPNKNTIELNYNNTYSFGYVSDAVNGVLKVLDSGKNTEIYNLGSFSASEFDVLCSIQNKLNLEEELIIQNNTNKKSCIINCDKLNNIGWSVEQNLEDSVSMFTQWYLNNNWWFK